jgi:hypothetical protein
MSFVCGTNWNIIQTNFMLKESYLTSNYVIQIIILRPPCMESNGINLMSVEQVMDSAKVRPKWSSLEAFVKNNTRK